ncbi:hypothetical protein CARUB_v10019539mg [Capsella rubella]|uniref:SKP1-like protein n=1 Tax=Capsella rubella TaxID=81985 RepID=R0HQ87_9BRAS|nr:SKP1-like protein 5 [Capsella rubella]EOA26113.1 hypothetical protein CARUB_v10019539mg [Capsella rubella]
MSTKTIKLKSSDGVSFEVEEAIAIQSKTIGNMVEDDCAGDVIPLANVTSKILEMVIEYCKEHVADSSTGDEKSKEEDLKKWDAEFMKKIKHPILFDVMMAANYLNIESLLDLTAQTVADLLSLGKTPEQLRAQFNIAKDLTDEEEAQIRSENQWAFE